MSEEKKELRNEDVEAVAGGNALTDFAKKHKRAIGIGAGVVGAGIGAGIAYGAYRNRKGKAAAPAVGGGAAPVQTQVQTPAPSPTPTVAKVAPNTPVSTQGIAAPADDENFLSNIDPEAMMEGGWTAQTTQRPGDDDDSDYVPSNWFD